MAEMLNAKANGNGKKLDVDHNDLSALPWPDCPVIDFSLLTSPNPDVAALELDKLGSALLSWNCFQLINHGCFLDKVREVSGEFFQLPEEEKMKYLRGSNDDEVEGFVHDVGLSHTNVSQTLNDYLFFTVYPKDQRKLHLWPHNPPALRSTLDEFTMKVQAVNEKLWRAMLKSVGLEGDEEDEEKMEITARVNFSPACPFPELPYASKIHTDESAVTYSLQDKLLDGLHVLKHDLWYKLPVMPQALFVKFGDQIQDLSNGKFKGTVHRVVTRSEDDRFSLALYCSLVPNK